MAGIWLARTGFEVTWIPEEFTQSCESRSLIPSSSLLDHWLKSVGIQLKVPHEKALGFEPMWLTSEHRVQWKQNKKLQLFDHLQEWGEQKAQEMQSWRYEFEDDRSKEQDYWRLWPRLQIERLTEKNLFKRILFPSILKDDGKKFWKNKSTHEWSRLLHSGGDNRGVAWRSESYWLPEYRDELLKELSSAATRFGVKTLSEPVISIHSRKQNQIEIHFEKHIQNFSALLLGMPWNQIASRLVHKNAHLENRKPISWKFTTQALVHREAIPDHLSPWLIWTEADAPSLRVHIDQRSDPVKIELETSMPLTDESLDPARLKQISGRMFRKLNEWIPYLEFHLSRVNPDFRDMKDLEDVKALIPYEKISQLPLHLLEYSPQPQGIQTKVPGVFRCNSESFSSLGYLSSWVSAMKIHAHFLSLEKNRAESPRMKAYRELWQMQERTGE